MQGVPGYGHLPTLRHGKCPWSGNRAIPFENQRFENSFLRRSVETHLGTVLIFDCGIGRELFVFGKCNQSKFNVGGIEHEKSGPTTQIRKSPTNILSLFKKRVSEGEPACLPAYPHFLPRL